MLVAVMGIFSPVISVAAALNLRSAAAGVTNKYSNDITITDLPTKTVKVGDTIQVPTVTGGRAELMHANKTLYDSANPSLYTPLGEYTEVGQYVWRFYVTDASDEVLFDSYTVNATKVDYAMTMPSGVVTVAPKNMASLVLPLPETYTVDGESRKIDSVVGNDGHYAVVTLKHKDANKNEVTETYRLYATVSLENNYLANTNFTFDSQNLTINLSAYQNLTGNLKVTYTLKEDANDGKILVVLPLDTITIKNVTKDKVTFANIPTAPSVSGLSYYSKVALTAPSAGSATVGKDSFAVEAQTSIVKVQAHLFADEPSSWSVNNNTSDVTKTLTFTVENGKLSNDYIEIDGLNVKVKALGWYRFQFQTSTLFGYKMNDSFSNDTVTQNGDNVQYWSDSVKIYRDEISPDITWVDEYDDAKVASMNAAYENSELENYNSYLPMTTQPDSTATKKVTVKDCLVLPAVFPHDNSTSYTNLKDVYKLTIEQIKDVNGKDVVTSNTASKGATVGVTTFKYNPQKALRIDFTGSTIDKQPSDENKVLLKNTAGLYKVTIAVRDVEPVFLGNNKTYSTYNNAHTTYKYLYFYVDSAFNCGAATDASADVNSPKIDESKKFQVSDVYQWEGNTLEFPVPSFSDEHTATSDLKIDYYLVKDSDRTQYKKLDYVSGGSRVTVELTDAEMTLFKGDCYIYAVARNFNGMQADLKHQLGTDFTLDTHGYFDVALFDNSRDIYRNGTKYKDSAEVAQYGYAWKRAAFTIHDVGAAHSATIAIDVKDTTDAGWTNSFKAGDKVKISSITANWGENIDGQMSVAVYSEKTNKMYNVYNGNSVNSEIVSSILTQNNDKYKLTNLYFTPDVSGKYLVVVTAKEFASKQVSVKVAEIEIGNSGEYHGGFNINGKGVNDDSVNDTALLGESKTLPDVEVYNDSNELVYVSRNRKLYDVSNMSTPVGDCVITAMGVSDPNCISGNKFTPNKEGKHKFKYECYLGGNVIYTDSYVINVTVPTVTANILMDEAYNGKKVLSSAPEKTENDANVYKVGTEGNYKYYEYDSAYTETKPAYAITLEQFQKANYGDANNFVVDSAELYNYLEPKYVGGAVAGYMYPAIAIPMPNITGDTRYTSEDVEITVQKSGSSAYLVSNKKANIDGSKESKIEKIGGYYVFRPEGSFRADTKDTTKYNDKNYLALAAENPSMVSGVYTVTYKVGETSLSYNMTIGNREDGQATLQDGFLTYYNGKTTANITDSSDTVVIDKDDNGHRYVTIDLSKFEFSGNETMLDLINKDGDAVKYYFDKVTVTVTCEDGTIIDNVGGSTTLAWSTANNETNAIKDENKRIYKFDLEHWGSGTYKVTAELYNTYTGTTVSDSIEFTLDTESTNKNINLNNVWGVILIVLSVGLLAGVIFYFVKTARATRFVDAPRALKAKGPKAEKTEEKENKETKATAKPAAKAEEAPKKDAE